METNVVENKDSYTVKTTKVHTIGLRFLQGVLIGLGAVLPGISGGVLCATFGIYRSIMELLSHPFRTLRKNYRILIPLILGGGFGFIVVARLLGFFLNRYPAPTVCLFVGLIGGMLPSLFREAGEKGKNRNSFVSLGICFAIVFTLLLCLNLIHAAIAPNFAWYLFCGFCIALSVIAPGMSFSTLLMPLGLYTPLISGIGSFRFTVLLPAAIGALLTVVLLARAVDSLMEHHYNIAFHGLIGIVMAATLVIIPFGSFTESISSCIVNLVCLAVGIFSALALNRFNQKIKALER